MKIPSLTLGALFLLSGSLPAQWIKMNPGFNDDLYSVDYYSANAAWIGSYNAVLKTADGGVSWSVMMPVKDELNIPIFPANMNDLAAVGADEVVAAGFLYTGNAEHVLKTYNGGQNWRKMTTLPGGSIPKYTEAIATWGDKVIVAANSGSFGHFWSSHDRGDTWAFISAGPIGIIEDLVYASADTVFAVGNGSVIRSDDGGNTWTFISVPINMETVSYRDGILYAGAGFKSTLLKSADRGETFETISLPFVSNGVVYAADKNTVLAASQSGLYISRSGGQTWEKFDLPGYVEINMIDFLNSEQGMAVGYGGYAIRTGNLSATPSLPLSFFEIAGEDLDFCLGDTLPLVNRSALGYSYEWRINDMIISTDYQPLISLNTEGDLKITLTVSNAFGSSTYSVDIRVFGHLPIPPLQLTLNADTICSGDKVVMTLPYAFPGGYYRLRKDGEDVGTVEYFSTVARFTTPEIYGQTHFQVIAFRYNTCFTDSLIQDVTIYDATPPNAPFFFSRDSACYYDSVKLLVPNTLPGYRYYWHSLTNQTDSQTSITGTGDTISISLPLLNAPETFAPKVVSVKYGCNMVFSPGKTVYAERPHPGFTLNNFNPELGEAVYAVNTSVNPMGAYLWDFGPDATPRYSNLAEPSGITFGATGPADVKLRTATPLGCLDSLTRPFRVIDPVPLDDCRYAQSVALSYVSSVGAETTIAYDYEDNLFFWYAGEDATSFNAYSNHGDSLVIPRNGDYLTKFNRKGVPQWTIEIPRIPGLAATSVGDLEIDPAGNIYGCQMLLGDGSLSVRLLKFDKHGILQWDLHYLEFIYTERVALKVDPAGYLYVCGGSMLRKYDPEGQLLWVKTGTFSDLDIDAAGLIWVNANSANNRDLQFRKYDPEGNLLFTSPALRLPNGVIGSEFIKLDELGNIYMSGVFRGQFIFDNDTISDIYPGGPVHEDVFLCKMKPDGRQEWIKHFRSLAPTSVKGIAAQGNHILMMATSYGDSVRVAGLPPLTFPLKGRYLYHTDSLGGSEQLVKLYQTDLNRISYYDEGKYLRFKPGSNAHELALAFEFDTPFAFAGDSVRPYSRELTAHNTFIGRSSLNCLLPGIPVSPVPYSYFLPSIQQTCAGEYVHFQDLSSNQPTSWQWSFPGGIPAVSADPNPVVRYENPGTFTATLVAANAAGQGTVFTKKIVVLPMPVISLSGNPVACEGQKYVYLEATTDTPGASYQWQDSSATQDWTDIAGAEDYRIEVAPEEANNGKKYRCLLRYACATYPTKAVEVSVAPLPAVSCVPQVALCLGTPPLALHFGSPAGGVYSGFGMVNDSVFVPMGNIEYPFPIAYTYTDPNGCYNTATMEIHVEDCPRPPCENPALDFSGLREYAECTALNNFPANSDFTFEAWVTIDYGTIWEGCEGATFRRLFSLAGPDAWVEIGQCGSNLAIYWKDGSIHGPFTTSNVYLFDKSLWHIAAVRKGSLLQVFLDGVPVYLSTAVGTLNLTTFRLGFPANGGTEADGWIGVIDDVRLWKTARTAAQIAQDRKACLLTGQEPGLLLYWKLDDGESGANNTHISQINDFSPNGNHGILANFALEQNRSNFVCSNAPLLYGSFLYPPSTGCGIPGLLTDLLPLSPPPAQMLNYFWDFGNGATSTDPTPLYQSQACNSNTVCLTISGEGCSVTHCAAVEDTPPQIHCPANLTTNVYEPACAEPAFGLNPWGVSDNCHFPEVAFTISGATSLAGTGDAGGSVFVPGESVVQYMATDSCGNAATCSFTVTAYCSLCFYDLETSLTGFFPFNGDAFDASPTGIPGVVTDATLTEGHDGAANSAFHFNGGSSGITCGGDNRGVGDQVSVCAWVRTTSGQQQWVAGKYSGEEDRGYQLVIGDDSGQFAGRAAFSGRNGAGILHTSGFSTTALNDGQWHCLVGIAADNYWQIYVDGNLENNAPGGTFFLAPSESQPLTIGWHTDANSPLRMAGDIDDVQLYNRALSPCDIDSVCGTVGIVPTIEQTASAWKLQLFPNPNTGLFTVDLSQPAPVDARFRIADLTGRFVLEQKAVPASRTQTVDAAGLPGGLYFLQVISGNRVLGTGRFVKN